MPLVTRNDQLSLKADAKETRRRKVAANKASKRKGRKGKKGKKGRKGGKARKVKADSPSKRKRGILKRSSKWSLDAESGLAHEPADAEHGRQNKKPRKAKTPPSGASGSTGKGAKPPKSKTNKGERAKSKANTQAKSKASKATKPKAAPSSTKGKNMGKGTGRGRGGGRGGRGGQTNPDIQHHCEKQVTTLVEFAHQVGADWDHKSSQFKAHVRSLTTPLEKHRLNIYWTKTTCGVHDTENQTDPHHFSFNDSRAYPCYRTAVATKCAEMAAT